MAEKILITLDEESQKALEHLLEISERKTNRSKIIRDLLLAKVDADKGDSAERAVLASVRKTERDLQVVIGVLNSITLGFSTLADASYEDPDEHKHDILRGAELAENAKIRKRIQAKNAIRNGAVSNE